MANNKKFRWRGKNLKSAKDITESKSVQPAPKPLYRDKSDHGAVMGRTRNHLNNPKGTEPDNRSCNKWDDDQREQWIDQQPGNVCFSSDNVHNAYPAGAKCHGDPRATCLCECDNPDGSPGGDKYITYRPKDYPRITVPLNGGWSGVDVNDSGAYGSLTAQACMGFTYGGTWEYSISQCAVAYGQYIDATKYTWWSSQFNWDGCEAACQAEVGCSGRCVGQGMCCTAGSAMSGDLSSDQAKCNDGANKRYCWGDEDGWGGSCLQWYNDSDLEDVRIFGACHCDEDCFDWDDCCRDIYSFMCPDEDRDECGQCYGDGSTCLDDCGVAWGTAECGEGCKTVTNTCGGVGWTPWYQECWEIPQGSCFGDCEYTCSNHCQNNSWYANFSSQTCVGENDPGCSGATSCTTTGDCDDYNYDRFTIAAYAYCECQFSSDECTYQDRKKCYTGPSCCASVIGTSTQC